MKIDTHVHIFNDAIREKASKQLSDTAQLPRYTDFSDAETRMRLKELGVDLGVVLPIATKPSQQSTINTWAASLMHGNLISFGTIHPMAQDAAEELQHICQLGLYGIKMHPDYQYFFADEERLYPLYEAIEGLGLPLCFHVGVDPLSPNLVHATPQMIAKVHRDFPKLKLIAAHLGGVCLFDDVEKYIVGTNVYIDTSMSPLYCSQAQFSRIIKNHGADKVLFATDLPWSHPQDMIAMLEKAGLSSEELEKVYWKNAASLLQIPKKLLHQD